MARLKNALRGHFVAPMDPEGATKTPAEEKWLELARGITSIGDDTDEETDDTGFYDGDGNPETTVTSVTGAYSPEGYYDPEDPAQKLIAGMKYKTGSERNLWHKVISSDGKTQTIGPATATDIIAGAGDATEYEDFSCTIKYNKIPTVTPK